MGQYLVIGVRELEFSLITHFTITLKLSTISSTYTPGDIQQVVSEGRLQPVAFPSLADLRVLTPPGRENIEILVGIILTFWM